MKLVKLLEELSLKKSYDSGQDELYNIMHNGEYLSIYVILNKISKKDFVKEHKKFSYEDIKGVKEMFIRNNKLGYGFDREKFLLDVDKGMRWIINDVDRKKVMELKNNKVELSKYIDKMLLPANESRYLVMPLVNLVKENLDNGYWIKVMPASERLEEFYFKILDKYFKRMRVNDYYIILK